MGRVPRPSAGIVAVATGAVHIDKIGTAPLDQCVVTSVRNKQQFTQLVPLLGGDNDGVLFPAIISQPDPRLCRVNSVGRGPESCIPKLLRNMTRRMLVTVALSPETLMPCTSTVIL